MKNLPITIVSGLPRSGTSLMMKILEKGGLQIVTDHIRKADIDNPDGYYEFEKVKQIKKDISWLADTRGKAFKMISMLLFDLPAGENYKIIFMERDIEEILASQKKMLTRKQVKQQSDDSEMATLFLNHLEKVKAWLSKQSYISVLYLSYNDLVLSPEPEIQKLIDFLPPLGKKMDAKKMALAVNPELYRNRSAQAPPPK